MEHWDLIYFPLFAKKKKKVSLLFNPMYKIEKHLESFWILTWQEQVSKLNSKGWIKHFNFLEQSL